MEDDTEKGKYLFLLHYYKGGQFIGQGMNWVKLTNPRTLAALVDLLGAGVKASELTGTSDMPLQSEEFRELKRTLQAVYDRVHWHQGNPFDFTEATTVRVMQITFGHPVGPPLYSPR